MAPLPERRFFADPFGTVYAVEVVVAAAWDAVFTVLPDVRHADARIVLTPAPRPAGLPEWLVVADEASGAMDDSRIASLAARAWLRSPYHRAPGALATDYVVAGFQAFCPPHPPCPPGPAAREILVSFARRRGGVFAPLAEEARDGFDRWLRVTWRSPEHFARAVLAERMADAGEDEALALLAYVEDAEVCVGPDTLSIAEARQSLLERLTPMRYFADPAGWQDAHAEALAWRAGYEAAYLAHFNRVARQATEALAGLMPAIHACDTLKTFNRSAGRGQPVGQESVERLRRAVADIAAIPDGLDTASPRSAGVMLGRVPSAFAEARLAAAGVMAAVAVQHRRAMA